MAAAGNDGTAADAVSYAPGNDPYVISVGGADDRGTSTTSDDVLAPWSSRGVTQDGFSKPEVVAPGAHMRSTLARGSDFAELCPDCVVDGDYFQVGGTSMATGLGSGEAALILEDHPGYTPDQVKGAMINLTRDLTLAGSRKVVAEEAAADQATNASTRSLVSNQGLSPNELIDRSTGLIDYARVSWRRVSWRTADGSDPLAASWSRVSWRSSVADAQDDDGADVDPTRVRWRRVSWRTSFDK